MKKLIIFIFSSLLFIPLVDSAYIYTDCAEYGFYAIENYDGTCSCQLGTHLEKNNAGQLVCIKDMICSEIHGKYAVDNADGTCSCQTGYYFLDDLMGNRICVSGPSMCTYRYGDKGTYNETTKNCDCIPGYELSAKRFSSSFECISCVAKYGSNGVYNEKTQMCECKKGYSIKGMRCEKDINTKNPNQTEGVYGLTHSKCPDLINGYMDVNGACYCKSSYIWSRNDKKCIKNPYNMKDLSSEEKAQIMFSKIELMVYNRTLTNRNIIYNSYLKEIRMQLLGDDINNEIKEILEYLEKLIDNEV